MLQNNFYDYIFNLICIFLIGYMVIKFWITTHVMMFNFKIREQRMEIFDFR